MAETNFYLLSEWITMLIFRSDVKRVLFFRPAEALRWRQIAPVYAFRQAIGGHDNVDGMFKAPVGDLQCPLIFMERQIMGDRRVQSNIAATDTFDGRHKCGCSRTAGLGKDPSAHHHTVVTGCTFPQSLNRTDKFVSGRRRPAVCDGSLPRIHLHPLLLLCGR